MQNFLSEFWMKYFTFPSSYYLGKLIAPKAMLLVETQSSFLFNSSSIKRCVDIPFLGFRIKLHKQLRQQSQLDLVCLLNTYSKTD